MTRRKTSPLESATQLYLNKQPKHASIHIKEEEETLEFYPAGYTKISSRNNKNRQQTLQNLYELAVSLGTQDNLYPFEEIPHNIKLVHQRNNPKDPSAMYVVIESPVPGSLISHIDNFDIGYVPIRISTLMYRNKEMFNGGRILKIKANFHKKFYTCKVVLGYGENRTINADFGQTTRFLDIASEL